MKYISIICVCLFLSACITSYEEAALHGQWKTTDWSVVDSGKKISQKMDFTFSADERYEVDYGSQKEVGRYWISGTSLRTIEDGQSEKTVKIKQLTSDSLVLEMNRAGSLEMVVLLKQ